MKSSCFFLTNTKTNMLQHGKKIDIMLEKNIMYMSLSEQTNKSIINYLWAVSGMTNGNLWAVFFCNESRYQVQLSENIHKGRKSLKVKGPWVLK